jgi:hypothetical protein
VAWLSLVWIANIYMAVFARLKLEVKQERLELARQERDQTEGFPSADAGGHNNPS